MRRALEPTIWNRSSTFSRLACWVFAGLLAPGCGEKPKPSDTNPSKPPTVKLTHPQLRDITRTIGQPSFIESYERTSIYPKLTAYIEKWFVDIGDEVKKGDVLATLFVPELVEDYGTKRATVELDKQRIDLAHKRVEVAEANVKSAQARLEEAKAILGKYQSEVDRWDTEIKRLKKETDRGVVDPQILLESTNQWKSTVAARDAAKATIAKAEADLSSRQAELAEATVDVKVAEADLSVADSEARRLKAWVGYLTLPAPYDGVIVARNANTGDFVLPMMGDPTAMQRSPHLAPGNQAAPIYVVDRTDIVRIFVDIPEQDADYVHNGTSATVLVQAFREEPIPGTVTRTSWALNVKSRTLRAEIDLPNPGGQIRPGMYAYADTIINRPGARVVPRAVLTYKGDKTFYWRYENGKAVRTEIQTGVSDGDSVEITKQRIQTSAKEASGKGTWKPVDGSEAVIVGDLSLLTDGEQVRAASDSKELTRK